MNCTRLELRSGLHASTSRDAGSQNSSRRIERTNASGLPIFGCLVFAPFYPPKEKPSFLWSPSFDAYPLPLEHHPTRKLMSQSKCGAYNNPAGEGNPGTHVAATSSSSLSREQSERARRHLEPGHEQHWPNPVASVSAAFVGSSE